MSALKRTLQSILEPGQSDVIAMIADLDRRLRVLETCPNAIASNGEEHVWVQNACACCGVERAIAMTCGACEAVVRTGGYPGESHVRTNACQYCGIRRIAKDPGAPVERAPQTHAQPEPCPDGFGDPHVWARWTSPVLLAAVDAMGERGGGLTAHGNSPVVDRLARVGWTPLRTVDVPDAPGEDIVAPREIDAERRTCQGGARAHDDALLAKLQAILLDIAAKDST